MGRDLAHSFNFKHAEQEPFIYKAELCIIKLCNTTLLFQEQRHKDRKNRGNYKLLKLLNYVKSAKYCKIVINPTAKSGTILRYLNNSSLYKK